MTACQPAETETPSVVSSTSLTSKIPISLLAGSVFFLLSGRLVLCKQVLETADCSADVSVPVGRYSCLRAGSDCGAHPADCQLLGHFGLHLAAALLPGEGRPNQVKVLQDKVQESAAGR